MKADNKQAQSKIFLLLLDADKPLRMADIVEGTSLSKQLVSYHITLMIKDGVIIPVDIEGVRYFTVQMIFLNDALFKKLLDSITPVAKLVASSLVYEHTDKGRESVIRNNLIAFLAAVSRKVK
jgi:DNA-binding transcriptional regulator GbsR (MarR family)